MATYPMTPEAEKALDDLKQASLLAAEHGFYVFLAARIEIPTTEADHTNTRWHTSVLTPDGGQDKVMLDHAFADAIRDLGVEWHNKRHDSKLVWQE